MFTISESLNGPNFLVNDEIIFMPWQRAAIKEVSDWASWLILKLLNRS